MRKRLSENVSAKPVLLVLQTIKNYLIWTIVYQAYRLHDLISRHDYSLLYHVSEKVEEQRLKIMMHLFGPAVHISVPKLLKNFKGVCGANRNYEKATMWLMPIVLSNYAAVFPKAKWLGPTKLSLSELSSFQVSSPQRSLNLSRGSKSLTVCKEFLAANRR